LKKSTCVSVVLASSPKALSATVNAPSDACSARLIWKRGRGLLALLAVPRDERAVRIHRRQRVERGLHQRQQSGRRHQQIFGDLQDGLVRRKIAARLDIHREALVLHHPAELLQLGRTDELA